jgi:hypothetical protein
MKRRFETAVVAALLAAGLSPAATAQLVPTGPAAFQVNQSGPRLWRRRP